MKTSIKFFFQFLGSIKFALILIALATIIVVVGTIIESKTGSHLLAAQYTYENTYFFFLLFLFFINILFAALRRWPFRRYHIPFLITHLGLLMIISGTMIKNKFGLQGQLIIWEGSGNQHVLLPHTHALLIEEKGQFTHQKNSTVELNSFLPNIYHPFHFPQLKFKVIGYSPHVKKKLETWIKGHYAYIAGFPSIPVHHWDLSQTFPEAASYHFTLATYFPNWSILALRTSQIEEALLQAYLQQLTIHLKTKENEAETLSIPLQQALQHSFSFADGSMDVALDLSSSFSNEKIIPSLNFTWVSHKKTNQQTFTIDLQGEDALMVKTTGTSWFEVPFIVDLSRSNPLLCIIEDEQQEHTFIFTFDSYGRLYAEKFNSSHLESIIAYEQGFNGYGVQTSLPIPSFPAGREDKEKANAYELLLKLQQALTENASLSPPLVLFKQACQQSQIDFSNAFIQFLVEWNKQPGCLYSSLTNIPKPLNKVIKYLNWQNISNDDKQAIQWTYRLLNQLENSWKKGSNPLHVLKQYHWPFIEEIEQAIHLPNVSFLNLISQQISSIIHYLPAIDFPLFLSDREKLSLLSAYFRIYGIDYRSILPYQGKNKESFDHLENFWKAHSTNSQLKQTVIFETPLSYRLIPDLIPSKPEEQVPGILLEIQEGQNKQIVSLAYEASGGGLKWPILNGKYIIRFQPKRIELPYRVRLRQARQISYPESQQIYSYESDVLISENGKPPIEQTLSMNRVYETWDGYRFYLAGIGNLSEPGFKRIQLAVNHDPAKYFLTYPGVILVFIGIILLFWMKKLKKLFKR